MHQRTCVVSVSESAPGSEPLQTLTPAVNGIVAISLRLLTTRNVRIYDAVHFARESLLEGHSTIRRQDKTCCPIRSTYGASA